MKNYEYPAIFSRLTDNLLFYDCEIANCIYKKDGYKNCKGWNDFAGMGISVIGTFCTRYGYAVHSADELDKFQELLDRHEVIIGFNSASLDDKLIRANGVNIQTTYDLLREVRVASKQPPVYVRGRTKAGYNLNTLAKSSLGIEKIGSGSSAPELWQDNKLGELIDYCLKGVAVLVHLYCRKEGLVDPTTGKMLKLSPIEPIEASLF